MTTQDLSDVTPSAASTRRPRPWSSVLALGIAATLMSAAMVAQAGLISAAASRSLLGGNDLLQWGTAADDLTNPGSPYAVTSGGGIGAVATLAGGFALYVQNGAAFNANFSNGEIVLDTNFNNGPIRIDFGSAVRGVGFNIAHETFGAFTASLAFYGAGNVLFDTVLVNGLSSAANDGTAAFLGGRSNLRDITRVDISVGLSGGSRAFSINQMSLLSTDAPVIGGVPEPSSLALLPLALAGAWFSRRLRPGRAAATSARLS